jgi:serine/threonine-protein phosphatase 2A activator
MYFSAIQFIYDVKRGPFWEHSPVLYDISGIKDGWAKINKGMIKMWAAEVLGKFPVVQHFPFGSLFEWKANPEAANATASMHAQQQPAAGARSMDVPPPPPAGMGMGGGAGTKAPWAKVGAGAIPPMQASSGVPSTRAPWAVAGRQTGAAGSAMPSAAAPWAATQRQTPSTAAPFNSPQRPTTGMPPPTTAPWANKDGV